MRSCAHQSSNSGIPLHPPNTAHSIRTQQHTDSRNSSVHSSVKCWKYPIDWERERKSEREEREESVRYILRCVLFVRFRGTEGSELFYFLKETRAGFVVFYSLLLYTRFKRAIFSRTDADATDILPRWRFGYWLRREIYVFDLPTTAQRWQGDGSRLRKRRSNMETFPEKCGFPLRKISDS